jgi:anti-sigma-K factor RskA
MSPAIVPNSPLGSTHPGGPRHPQPVDLVLYAMQLLAPEEAAVIANHLPHCAECRDELARILGDLAVYALTVDPESPPELARQRLLRQVAREKKVVPIAADQPQAAPRPHPQASFGRSGSVRSLEHAPARRSASRAIAIWSGWVVAAALAVAVTFFYRDRQAMRDNLVVEDGLIQRLNANAVASHQLMDALADPRAVRVTLTTKTLSRGGPAGGVTYNADKGALVFLASELDPLQPYKTYQLWIIPQAGGAPVPAGTFHPDDQGNASIILPDLPRGIPAKAFGVTVEDDGGAQTPTLPIIMAGS